jgi:NADPH:quinone reductase
MARSMKAVTITRAGGPEVLKIQDRAVPDPGPDQIRVRVIASAVNRADLLQRRGAYPPAIGYPPDVPGLEYVGQVDSVGSSVVEWRVGDRAMGIVGGGGHAEFVCVHEREALPVPESLADERAAAVPEAFLTAFDALILQLQILPGEKVLVHAAASGVGTAAVQLARVAGAVTFGSSRTREKLERLRELGLDHAIDTAHSDWPDRVEEAAGAAGLDAILDLVAGQYLPINLRLLRTRGRALVVGTLGGARAELDLSMLMRKRIRLTGTVLRSRPVEEKISLARDFVRTVLPLLASGALQPVIETSLPFARIADAHRLMETNSTLGKIVLIW